MNCCFVIKATSEGKADSYGTGFLVNDKNIITNSHIISYYELGESNAYDKIYASINNNLVELTLIENNVEKDYSILHFANEKNYLNFNFLSVNYNYNPKIGDEVFTIGNLNNYGLAVNFGHISSLEKTIEKNGNKNKYYQTDIEISPGSSGGPVFNSSNNVIGIMTLKMRDNNGEYIDGASFYLPINVLNS